MLIITDLPESQPVTEKSQLLNLYIQLCRNQQQLRAIGKGHLIPASLLELAQITAALRFHHRVCDAELSHALEVHS